MFTPFIERPQLWLTIAMAIAIVAAFLYTANLYIGIAQQAQDELVNVRIGSLQDAFAPLAAELSDQSDVLRSYMRHLQELNPTIVDFDIVSPTSTPPNAWVVTLSADSARENRQVFRQDFILHLAQTDTARSFTFESNQSGERYFSTARAIVLRDGAVSGIVLTRQTLSAADAQIAASTHKASVTLIVILLFLLLLFFRHARIIDYAALYRKLKEVDMLKDEFIAMASHELRAPLTAIRGYVDVLKGGDMPKATQDLSLERIDISARELDSLIVDMLDVSRIEQGRLTMNLSRADVSGTLVEICDTWHMKAVEKGLTLTCEAAPGAFIMVDTDRFRQVIVNLLSNSVKYTQKGSIGLTASADEKYYTISVNDTGIGMTNDERDHLFNKFYRAEGRDVRDQAGTGLGLWITKQIVEMMGASITVESIKGVGSHFIVRFALAKE
ncbi:HAMP domain-containing histidine kinase [Candidatus Kaiserbacteria bacterium]|nr:HAMP domain-containing histidine kinase [Candidatus Kaiserbacteria bacterium]